MDVVQNLLSVSLKIAFVRELFKRRSVSLSRALLSIRSISVERERERERERTRRSLPDVFYLLHFPQIGTL